MSTGPLANYEALVTDLMAMQMSSRDLTARMEEDEARLLASRLAQYDWHATEVVGVRWSMGDRTVVTYRADYLGYEDQDLTFVHVIGVKPVK